MNDDYDRLPDPLAWAKGAAEAVLSLARTRRFLTSEDVQDLLESRGVPRALRPARTRPIHDRNGTAGCHPAHG